MKVSNKKCIFRLGFKNMKMARARNLVAIIAIALTALLFTALFTIIMSISKSFEYSNFRQIGTSAHGEFKRLDEEQFDQLKNADGIESYGVRRILGVGADEILLKNYTEISYMDENSAKWSFVMPTTGRLPKENTNEAATDTRLLEALGIPKEIGTEFSVTINVDGIETTESFVLCGFWEFDGASPASNILVPESRLTQVFTKLDTQFIDGNTGCYFLLVMLESANNIEMAINDILEEYGYSIDKASNNYLPIGINWGYMSEGFTENMDAVTIVSIVVMLLGIFLTGYLIIYNVFRISVSNEIRHYGMLKTIGTTGRQISHIILIQALILSMFGIPMGLILGWGIGAALFPFVINECNIPYDTGVSANSVIFIFSTIFAVATVLISCFRPGKIAASVSPIEALRYTESSVNQGFRKGTKGILIPKMAMANLAGSKGKTALTIISLSLSVVLFTVTVTFTNSFSMEKYLSDINADFFVAGVNYFRSGSDLTSETTITKEDIDVLKSLEGVTESYSAYGISVGDMPQTFYSEEHLHRLMSKYAYDEQEIVDYINERERNENDLVADSMMMLGMDKEGLEKIEVLNGDINKLSEEGYIAVEEDSEFKVGDKIDVRYVDSVQYVNSVTGSIYTDIETIPESEWPDIKNEEECHYKQYEICAVVDMSSSYAYSYSIVGDLFLMESERFNAELANGIPLYIAFNVSDEAEQQIEQFLSEYTENNMLDYASRAKTEKEFESFRKTFIILGGTLSFIVALIGVLNFVNTVLTGIISRGKELATLQAIGMTGKQLKTMLVYEGLIYTTGAVVTAVLLNLLSISMSSVVEKLFWFCEYKFTLIPIVVTVPLFVMIGVVVPTIMYRIFVKKSIVERLRKSE